MGPIGTPKVVQKGSILRPLASQKGAKGPLWRPKGAKTSHCEGPGRLKWCPKAHLDGFGVPRCPQKLHFNATDAQNWPQGLHFEGFGPQFVYFNVFFGGVCVIFCFYSYRLSFCPAMLSLQPPSTSIISKNWQKQASPAENPRRTSIKTRSQHH